MDSALRQRLEMVLRPLYQDLDGVSRFDEVERIAAIARLLYTPPTTEQERAFELLLLFHRLGRWLEKPGNLSRVLLVLAGDVSEEELRRTAASIRQLEAPATEMERATAAAMVVDRAGLRGLAEQFGRARREGQTIGEIARAGLQEAQPPPWVPDAALEMLRKRDEVRREFCRRLLEESC